MKKLSIILFLLVSSFAYGQIDTVNYELFWNNGKYTSMQSKNVVRGLAGGQYTFNYEQKSLLATSYDSTVFAKIANSTNGKFTSIENIVPYYGKDSGTVRMLLYDAPTSSTGSAVDTSLFKMKRDTTLSTGYTTRAQLVTSLLPYYNTTNLDTSKITFNDQNNSLTGVNQIRDSLLFYPKGQVFAHLRLKVDSLSNTESVFKIQNSLSTNSSLMVQGTTSGYTNTDGALLQIAGTNAFLFNYESGYLSFGTNGQERWRVSSAGAFMPVSDNAVDLGASGTEIRSIYYDGDIIESGVTKYLTSAFGAPNTVTAPISMNEVTLSINGTTMTIYTKVP